MTKDRLDQLRRIADRFKAHGPMVVEVATDAKLCTTVLAAAVPELIAEIDRLNDEVWKLRERMEDGGH